MSDKKYTDDPQVTVLLGTEQIPTAQLGLDKYSTPLDIAIYALAHVVSNFTGSALITTVGEVASGTWNSRIKPRETIISTGANVAINVDATDVHVTTALASGITYNATTGTANRSQSLIIKLTDNGTPRVIGFDASFNFSAALPNPALTVATQTIYFFFIRNGATNKWDCIDIKGGY